MNGNKSLIQEISSVLNGGEFGSTEVVVAPPAPLLTLAREKFKSSIGVAAQNCSQGTLFNYGRLLMIDLQVCLSVIFGLTLFIREIRCLYR